MPITSSSFAARTQALVGRFRRQRPLRAGSLLMSMIGDAILPHGGRVALASLIELSQPFGLTERLVRTSIGRLANQDWVTFERSGRSSYYSLTPNGKARFAEATQRIYAAPMQSWNGEWTLVIIPASLKALRDSVREELSWLGFGEFTPGVFAHPTHEAATVRERLAQLDTRGGVIIMQGALAANTSDTQLAAIGWDFDELARRYRRFVNMFAPVEATLTGKPVNADAGETAFILRTLLLHEYRKIHLRDPLLPARLLPDPWIGADAYGLCRTLYAKVFPASERYLSATVQMLDAAPTQPTREVLARFGGLSLAD
jgi:phenylacetic acid degradation operon negative regulatory protein